MVIKDEAYKPAIITAFTDADQKATSTDGTITTTASANIKNSKLDVVSIALQKGGWVKIQNGVPVIANYQSYFEAGLDAEVFNVETTDETPTANDAISTSEVSIIAGNGAVTITGAQGKKVTISNVLGQTVANTVRGFVFRGFVVKKD